MAPETLILTDTGYHQISTLQDQHVRVWNGKEFSDTIVRKTGTNQKLITVEFDNGLAIRCTPYHKFYIEEGSRPAERSKARIVEAKNLCIGMRIIRYTVPTLNTSTEHLPHAYTQGLFAAEGTYNTCNTAKHQCSYKKVHGTSFCKRHQAFSKKYESENQCCAESNADKPMIFLYGEKQKLLNSIKWQYFNHNETSNRIDVSLPHSMKEKDFVPVNYSLDTRIKWLEGYLDGDGTVVDVNGLKNIQVCSTNKEFITNVLLMLQTLGVCANIGDAQQQGMRKLPDGHGGCKQYLCEQQWRLNIDCGSLLHLIDLGFAPKRLDVSCIRPPHHMTNKFVRVSGVIDREEIADTFCFNEPKEHKGIFNGILTGQCVEIMEYTAPDEIAVCNLASICLPEYWDAETKTYNYAKLHDVSKVITRNLNKVIDVNYYPVPEARTSNLRHRPIGIGVQGLADVYVQMRLPFDSPEASEVNKRIFETIYHGALEASTELAKQRAEDLVAGRIVRDAEFDPPVESAHPGAYKTFEGCPASKGTLQFDMWGVTPDSGLWEWEPLKEHIKAHGLRNSLLLAPMPTASTSQIMGWNECFEPYTSNIYKRKTLAGEFILVNKFLVEDLSKLGLWTQEIKNQIIIDDGSVQNIPEIPDDIKALYKTVWEIKQKVVIDQAADRGAYICQSQSMNLFVENPDFKKLSSMHFYAWSKGLKTGMYYLRTRTKAKTQHFTMDVKQARFTNLKLETSPSYPNLNEQPQLQPHQADTKQQCDDEVCYACSA